MVGYVLSYLQVTELSAMPVGPSLVRDLLESFLMMYIAIGYPVKARTSKPGQNNILRSCVLIIVVSVFV